MSLDIYINYRKPKMVNYEDTHAACGSTMRIGAGESLEEYWSANITHNMGKMASEIKTHYRIGDEEYDNNLYEVLWRMDEYCPELANTDVIGEAVQHGIAYMVEHKKELLKYNPSNNWGSYDGFLQWLIKLMNACEENPNCTMENCR